MPTPLDAATLERLLSPIPESAEAPTAEPTDGVGLCLSGGGYRAMLFHVGVLWRLNELKWLSKLTRVSSVSGGSITAAMLGVAWSRLGFVGDVARAFQAEVVDPIRTMASTSIDTSSVITGALLPGVSISDRVAKRYEKVLFKDSTLQDLPDNPRFIICATNVQSGSLFRFSKQRVADWQVGEVVDPSTRLCEAVAASSAFPPVLSPAELSIDAGAMQPFDGATLNRPPYSTDIVLTDGGVYDNLGIEHVWKRCKTVLVSDAGQKIAPDPSPAEDWPQHMVRVLNIIDNQVRSLRKRQVIGSFEAQAREGAYWGIRTDIGDYGLENVLDCPHEKTLRLAAIPTRLKAVDDSVQETLINWGYAVCDAAMRRHVDASATPPIAFPYSGGMG